MSMDLRVMFQRQSKTAKEGKDKKTAVVVLEDDEDDFRRTSVDSGSGTKRGKTGGGGEIGETKRKRRRKRIMDSDSEDEAPKKKVKATPTKVGSKVKSPSAVEGKSKVKSPSAVRGRSKAKSSSAVGVKKEVKSVTDFFGSAPVKRSPYFKSASDKKQKDEEVVRVSESPTEPPDNHHSSVSQVQSKGSSQPSYTATPTKRLSIEVTRIATPPKMSPRPQSRNGGDSNGEREGGREKEREKEGVRRSPRKKLKRGRGREEETEEARESGKSSKSDCDVCGRKICKCAQKTKKSKSETSEKSIEERKERVVRTKPPKARKVIKYLDDGEEEEKDKKEDNVSKGNKQDKSSVKKDKDEEKKRGEKRKEKETVNPLKLKRDNGGDESVGKGEGGGGDGKKREQAVLTTSGSSSTLACVSPHKPGASPRRQGTPEREGYLVKQPGLTFDKDKSASPVKTPKKKIEDTRRENVRVPTLTKQVSTPVKPVSKTSPVKQVSTPVQPVSRPQAPPTKTTTPSSGPRPGGGTTPGTTPKVYRGSSYRSYMNRSGPKAPGSKVVPKGEENCFDGLTFVITGVLDSLDREEAADIVKRYGGKVTTGLSRRTSYLVMGEEAGEAKLAKAAQLGTKRIDEDGLLELLKTRPGKKAAGRRGSVKPPATTSRKSSSSSSPPVSGARSRGSTRGAKFGSKSPPSATVRGNDIIATPTRKHVTTPIAMATPSPGGASSSVETPKPQKNGDLMWVDKYRPRSLKNVIGQQGDKSSARKLLRWLMDWDKKGKGGVGGGRKGGGGANQGNGAGLRAALLSGPPGVGKTTTAVLACEEAGYSYVELNASATRSKRTLHEDVAGHLDCTSLDVFRTTSSSGGKVGMASGRRHALIMDEVDGMAGNEDRGGMQEVISMIKTTKVPIICICNDRQHQKIRSLSNHCFDLRFPRPKVDQIRGAMMSICYKEGVKMVPNALAEVIMASGQDIRQVLHNLSVWTATDKNMDYDKAKETAKSGRKESKLNPFDVIKLVFMPVDGSRELSLAERSDLFFHDYSLAPLFVQENYPSVRPLNAKGDLKQTLRLLAEAADCVSDGDIVEKRIRSASQWGLLPVQAIFSSVLPGQLMRGGMGRPEFPRWLGNRSTRGKNDRLLQELQRHTRLRASCNKTEFGLDYLPVLHSRLTQPLLSQGGDGVPGVVAMMTTYDLVREDWDSIVELNQFSGQPNKISELPSKVKAAFTRAFNKEHHKTHYSISDAKKSRVASTSDYHDDDNEEKGPDSEPESDSYSDRMLKMKATTTASSSRATKREGGGGGKGKGVAGKNPQKKGKTKK